MPLAADDPQYTALTHASMRVTMNFLRVQVDELEGLGVTGELPDRLRAAVSQLYDELASAGALEAGAPSPPRPALRLVDPA
jgi:hypothetical protein